MSIEDIETGDLWRICAAVNEQSDNAKPAITPKALSAEVFLVKASNPSLSTARLLARFENASLQKTYEAIGIDLQQWKLWEAAKKSGESGPLSEKYPMISKLAWWFVEFVQFSPTEVRQLHRELLQIRSVCLHLEVAEFTTIMLSATQESMDTGQALAVYP